MSRVWEWRECPPQHPGVQREGIQVGEAQETVLAGSPLSGAQCACVCLVGRGNLGKFDYL